MNLSSFMAIEVSSIVMLSSRAIKLSSWVAAELTAILLVVTQVTTMVVAAT
jgi:hypothetical protein